MFMYIPGPISEYSEIYIKKLHYRLNVLELDLFLKAIHTFIQDRYIKLKLQINAVCLNFLLIKEFPQKY